MPRSAAFDPDAAQLLPISGFDAAHSCPMLPTAAQETHPQQRWSFPGRNDAKRQLSTLAIWIPPQRRSPLNVGTMQHEQTIRLAKLHSCCIRFEGPGCKSSKSHVAVCRLLEIRWKSVGSGVPIRLHANGSHALFDSQRPVGAIRIPRAVGFPMLRLCAFLVDGMVLCTAKNVSGSTLSQRRLTRVSQPSNLFLSGLILAGFFLARLGHPIFRR